MFNRTVSSKRHMKHKQYIEQLMSMLELKLIMITFENPHPINPLDRIVINRLNHKHRKIPIPNLNHFFSWKDFILSSLRTSLPLIISTGLSFFPLLVCRIVLSITIVTLQLLIYFFHEQDFQHFHLNPPRIFHLLRRKHLCVYFHQNDDTLMKYQL